MSLYKLTKAIYCNNNKVSLNKLIVIQLRNCTVIIAHIHVPVHVTVHLGSGPSILIVPSSLSVVQKNSYM